MVGSKDGLQPVEKTVIDRAVRNVYRPYLADPVPEKMPILQDLYDELLRQPEPEAKRVAAALELYVTGSLNMFNHRTNVELENRLVCFNIKELGKQLKQLGMLVIQDQVWNRVTVNRAAGTTTRYYCCLLYTSGGGTARTAAQQQKFCHRAGQAEIPPAPHPSPPCVLPATFLFSVLVYE